MFPNLHFESELQVDDKTRLDASTSYVDKSESELTSIEIEPEAGAGFISVFDSNSRNWFLDYQYATDGVKAVTVSVDNGSGPVTATFNLTVMSVSDDRLFSDDSDLISVRNDILKYLPDGRNSFLNVHRKAQQLILANLDERGIADVDGDRLTKDDVIDLLEVNEWSTFLTLSIIFQDLSNSVDDIFDRDAKRYQSKYLDHRKRALRLDLNNDGTLTTGEGANFSSKSLVRQ